MGESPVRFTRVWINNAEDEIPVIEIGEDFTIFAELETSIEIRGALLGLALKKSDGAQVTVVLSIDHGFRLFLPRRQACH